MDAQHPCGGVNVEIGQAGNRGERLLHGCGLGGVSSVEDRAHLHDVVELGVHHPALGDNAAFVEHRDVICHLLNLAQNMGAQHLRLPVLASFADHREEFALHEWVQTAGGLFQDEQLRSVHECLDQPELLAVTLGQRVHLAAQVHAESLGERLDRPGRDCPADLRELSQIHVAGATFGEGEVAGQVSDLRA